LIDDAFTTGSGEELPAPVARSLPSATHDVSPEFRNRPAKNGDRRTEKTMRKKDGEENNWMVLVE